MDVTLPTDVADGLSDAARQAAQSPNELAIRILRENLQAGARASAPRASCWTAKSILAVRFPEEVHSMLHPNQFQVNETWIIFKLNDAPVITDRDGDFNVFALMDAASCFILDTGFVSAESKELSETEARRILRKGYGHKKQYARELIISGQQIANNLSIAAEHCGISVSRVPEDQLRLLVDEARESFQAYISNGRCR